MKLTSFLHDTTDAAQKLLGFTLVRTLPEGIIVGRITETEAYLADDPASHSFRGVTPRTVPMFGAAGHVYVYFTYGNHYCLNVVTGAEGVGEAVLIRSLEIIEGAELAFKNRGGRLPLAEGPGRLCQALRIDKTLNGHSFDTEPLKLVPGSPLPGESVEVTPRIGISKAVDAPLRFLLKRQTSS